MFANSTREHQMEILRDDELYRHIRFKKPGTNIWRFDLVTWPGHLVVTGDLEDFHFARIPDMFEFFRSDRGDINPYYWSEKLCGNIRYQSYSQEKAKQQVTENYGYAREWLPRPHAPIWRAICADILDSEVIEFEDTFRRAVNDFRYETADGRFEFVDSWEWDLNDYDWHFLISLHAIVWGIKQYDRGEVVHDPVTSVPETPTKPRPRGRVIKPPLGPPEPPRGIRTVELPD